MGRDIPPPVVGSNRLILRGDIPPLKLRGGKGELYYRLYQNPFALMFLGDADRITPIWACQEAAQKIANPDLVKAVVYSDALHCFDMSELPPRTFYEFGAIGYHPQAAAASWEEIELFLGLPK